MELLFVTPIYPPEIGGPATYSRYMSDELRKRGHKVSIISLGEQQDSAEVSFVSRKQSKAKQEYKLFRKIMEKGKTAEAILALDPLAVGLPALTASKLLKKKLIVRFVGDVPWEKARREGKTSKMLDDFLANPDANINLLRLERIVLNSADKVVVPSNYLKSVLVKYHGVNPEKVALVPNFVLVPEGLDKEEARKKHSIEGKAMLFVGRLVPWKGVEGLLALFRKLRADVPELKFYIIGKGPEEEKLRELAPGGTVFLGDLGHREVLEYMAASDLLVLNSTYEGLSHVLIEAARIGVPVVSSDAGGNPDVVCGDSLFAVGDEDRFYGKARKALMDKEFASFLSRQNKEKASIFDISVSADRLMNNL
ncbi:glycosyltransferase [Candidatus Micrarchaeota archaeon]|nr:glycosyltransferase [Candidatus Micrarchaeota archaeon]